MSVITATRPCCGPYAQKQRRLAEVESTLKRLLVDPGITPRSALEKALDEGRLIDGWMQAHTCRPPLKRSRGATRL